MQRNTAESRCILHSGVIPEQPHRGRTAGLCVGVTAAVGKVYGKREKDGVCAPCEPCMPGSRKRPQQPQRERTAALCAMI